MNKVFALLIACLLLTAGTAFAGSGTVGAGQVISATNQAGDYTLGPPNAFAKLSTGVSLGWASVPATYAIETKHMNGDKCYGAAANDGKNYWQDCTVGAAAGTVTVSDSTAFNGWSSL